jgi:hypothetical protein
VNTETGDSLQLCPVCQAGANVTDTRNSLLDQTVPRQVQPRMAVRRTAEKLPIGAGMSRAY